MSFNPTRRFIR